MSIVDNIKIVKQAENPVILNAALTVITDDVFQKGQALEISTAILAMRLSALARLIPPKIRNADPEAERGHRILFLNFLRNLIEISERELEGSPYVEPEQTGQ